MRACIGMPSEITCRMKNRNNNNYKKELIGLKNFICCMGSSIHRGWLYIVGSAVSHNGGYTCGKVFVWNFCI